MADIAMLVAAEYERRVKNTRKAAAGDGSEAQLPFDMVSLLAQRLKHKIGAEKSELLSHNWVWEPRTQIGVAASHSFFSA